MSEQVKNIGSPLAAGIKNGVKAIGVARLIIGLFLI